MLEEDLSGRKETCPEATRLFRERQVENSEKQWKTVRNARNTPETSELHWKTSKDIWKTPDNSRKTPENIRNMPENGEIYT